MVGGAAGAAAGVTAEALGAGAASGIGGAAVGGSGVGSLVANLSLEHHEPYASVVLALTPNKLFLLGRHRVGPLASFANMVVITEIARSQLHTELQQLGLLKSLKLVNDADGAEYDYEVKPFGSGVDALLHDLNADQGSHYFTRSWEELPHSRS